MQMTLLCWNVAGRVRRQPEQAALIAKLEPDLVCLQEVTASTTRAWTTALRTGGFEHIAIARPRPGTPGDRPLRVLTAARAPLVELPIEHVPWPERALAARIDGL